MTDEDDARLNRIVQTMEQMLTHFENRLNTLENRLNQLDPNRNVILNERRVVERPGQLGGRTFTTSSTGTVQREIRICTCDICGHRIDEDFIICSCGKKICNSCAITYQNRNLCIDCLRNLIPLTKQAYKVLVAMANGVTDSNAISRITRIVKDDIVNLRNQLFALDLIIKRGISIFSELSITDKGLEAIGAYRQVFGGDPDIVQFDTELRRHLSERRR